MAVNQDPVTGKFLPGNKASTGRPRRIEEYDKITMSECTPEDWRAIIRKAITQAKRGDRYARAFLEGHYNPPAKRIDVTSNGRTIGAYDLSDEELAAIAAGQDDQDSAD